MGPHVGFPHGQAHYHAGRLVALPLLYLWQGRVQAAGVDSIIAARLVGPSGAVTGIDLVPEMLARASENARLAGVDNVTFRESSAEQLPFPDNSFDVLISNGVFSQLGGESGGVSLRAIAGSPRCGPRFIPPLGRQSRRWNPAFLPPGAN